jgi:hypothetical protein
VITVDVSERGMRLWFPPGTQSKNKENLTLAARQEIRENVFSNHNPLPEPHGRLRIGLKAPGAA